MGPLVSQEQYDRVTGYLDSGREEGAKAVAGGNAIDGKRLLRRADRARRDRRRT